MLRAAGIVPQAATPLHTINRSSFLESGSFYRLLNDRLIWSVNGFMT